MDKHDTLIEQLSRDARPVRRPSAPWIRAAWWMLVALPCGFLASLVLPGASADWSSPGALWAGLWLLASACLAALAMHAALTLAIPGRRVAHWRWLAGFVVASIVLGLLDVTGSADPVGHFGDGVYCYTFMLVAGTPMAVVVVGALRRTRSLHPGRSLALAGLAVAAMAQVWLGFCHPVSGQLADLGMHLAAGLTLIALVSVGGWRFVRL